MKRLIRKIRYTIWTLNGFFGKTLSLDIPQKTTILITYFDLSRMNHLKSQIRNLRKCNFIERIIISNHNPEIQIEYEDVVRDERLVIINQKTKRGCGFRWSIAGSFDPEYLIVMDDDIMLYPTQIASLFMHLISEPENPHGFTGMLRNENKEIEIYDEKDLVVDFICETYAVTRQHLRRYMEIEKHITINKQLSKMIESSADFIIISQSGLSNPRIHNLGRIIKCPTHNKAGIAVHKEEGFDKSLSTVIKSIDDITH